MNFRIVLLYLTAWFFLGATCGVLLWAVIEK